MYFFTVNSINDKIKLSQMHFVQVCKNITDLSALNDALITHSQCCTQTEACSSFYFCNNHTIHHLTCFALQTRAKAHSRTIMHLIHLARRKRKPKSHYLSSSIYCPGITSNSRNIVHFLFLVLRSEILTLFHLVLTALQKRAEGNVHNIFNLTYLYGGTKFTLCFTSAYYPAEKNSER